MAGLQWLICLDGSDRAETCALLVVGLNVLGGCNIICSANVLGGFGTPDDLDLRNNLDVLDSRKVFVSKCLTMVLRCLITISTTVLSV